MAAVSKHDRNGLDETLNARESDHTAIRNPSNSTSARPSARTLSSVGRINESTAVGVSAWEATRAISKDNDCSAAPGDDNVVTCLVHTAELEDFAAEQGLTVRFRPSPRSLFAAFIATGQERMPPQEQQHGPKRHVRAAPMDIVIVLSCS